jgi:hypothetical protein
MAVVTPAQGSGRLLARRYHLQRVLGRGAMGAVWEAEDTYLRRQVAVKEVVLPPGLSPEERAVSCERTLREARAIARLGHPNVVTLYDVLDEDTRPWVVMELVPSRSLADVVRQDGPLYPLRAATVGLAILGALEAAHAAGITHRDVKPGNILLGHDGRVKLTDFGIARAAGDTTITGTGLLIGSPSYLAPEIVRGEQAAPACDIWSLGATLYTAVEGRPPFSGVDAMDTLANVVQEPPAAFERAGPLVPALLGMLEKDPARRVNAVEARHRLLEVLRGGDGAEFPQSGPVGQPPAVPAATLAATAATPSQLAPAASPAGGSAARAAHSRVGADDRAGPGGLPAATGPGGLPAATGPGGLPAATGPAATETAAAHPAGRTAASTGATGATAAAVSLAAAAGPADTSTSTSTGTSTSTSTGGGGGGAADATDAARMAQAADRQPPARDPSPFPLLDRVDWVDRVVPEAAGRGSNDDVPTQVIPAQPVPFGLGGFAAERPPEDPRPDRTAAAMLIVAGLVVVLLVAAVVAARAWLGDSTGSTRRAGSTVPSASPTGPAGLPAGFRRYQHPGGFSVAIPEGWTAEQRGTGIVDAQEPGSSRFLRLIRNGSSAGALRQLKAAEPGFAQRNPEYRRLRLENVSYHRYDTAEWEFTFSRNGVMRHVLYRTIVADGASYGIYLSVPDSRWAASRRIFDVGTATLDLGS